jgi:hypothetical protein
VVYTRAQELLAAATLKFKSEAERYMRQVGDAEEAVDTAQAKLALKAEALADTSDRLAAAHDAAAALQRELTDTKATVAEQTKAARAADDEIAALARKLTLQARCPPPRPLSPFSLPAGWTQPQK